MIPQSNGKDRTICTPAAEEFISLDTLPHRVLEELTLVVFALVIAKWLNNYLGLSKLVLGEKGGRNSMSFNYQGKNYWKRFKEPVARKEISKLHRKIRSMQKEIERAKDSNERMDALRSIVYESKTRISSHDLTANQVQRIARILYT